jgi:hypothetical protein
MHRAFSVSCIRKEYEDMRSKGTDLPHTRREAINVAISSAVIRAHTLSDAAF